MSGAGRWFVRPARLLWSRRGWLGIWTVTGALLLLFLFLAQNVRLEQGLSWDSTMMVALGRLRTPWLDPLVTGLTWLGGALGAILVTLGTVALLTWSGERAAAAALTGSVIGGVLLNLFLKDYFARPRPDIITPLVTETSFSFPSGHAMTAVALYGYLAVLLWRRNRGGWALIPFLLTLAIALSRVYLGVHFPSDVLGALAVGWLWVGVVLAAESLLGYGRWRTADS